MPTILKSFFSIFIEHLHLLHLISSKFILFQYLVFKHSAYVSIIFPITPRYFIWDLCLRLLSPLCFCSHHLFKTMLPISYLNSIIPWCLLLIHFFQEIFSVLYYLPFIPNLIRILLAPKLLKQLCLDFLPWL